MLLRQRAVAVERAEVAGWDVVRVVVRDVVELAHELAGYGPDVVALEPADLRAGVVRVLTGALSAATHDAELRETAGRSVS